MKKIVLFALPLLAGRAFCAGGAAPSALGALTGPAGLTAAAPAVPPPAAVKAALGWADEVKKAYKQRLDNGELFALPVLKRAELPAAARQQLDRDSRAAGTAAAYRLTVKNRPAFVVHNGKQGRGQAAHIFEARGKLVAVARASASSPLYWEDLGAYSSGGSGGYYGPDDVWDGMGGQGPSYGGPDDTDDGGGCGSGGGWGGNSGGPDDTGYGGV